MQKKSHIMTHPSLMFAALVFSSFLAVAGQTPQTLQVAPLPRDGQVLVTFKLNQELTDDIRTKIHSGMLVSFIYKLDLRRASAIWLDREGERALRQPDPALPSDASARWPHGTRRDDRQ
jgi:hypothetical protein